VLCGSDLETETPDQQSIFLGLLCETIPDSNCVSIDCTFRGGGAEDFVSDLCKADDQIHKGAGLSCPWWTSDANSVSCHLRRGPQDFDLSWVIHGVSLNLFDEKIKDRLVIGAVS
jgi:hypothetical protein